eukprot:TRINITY_DN125_c0_g1_i7.p1 TRINITY_DN125_c0_g1~~TRINITY_DN125_c0_g1_i7.p1  ORF type:complete len:540 (-),score=231.22 TRINITY_DN125_c0_g1_i7:115-1734(-)
MESLMDLLQDLAERLGEANLLNVCPSQLQPTEDDFKAYPALANFDRSLPWFRLRFAFLLRFNKLVSNLLGLFDLRHSAEAFSLAGTLVRAKHFIFRGVKTDFLNSVLDATAVLDAKKPNLSIDRLELMARKEHAESLDYGLNTASSSSSSSSNTASTTSTFFNHFGHAYQQLRDVDKFSLRPPRPLGTEPFYAFNVEFKGEHVVGEAGPWRQLFSDISEELVAANSPILVPCPNAVAKTGENRDKYTLRSNPSNITLCEFLGVLIGCCIRCSVRLNIDLAGWVWKPLVGESLTRADLSSIDSPTAEVLRFIETSDADTFEISIEETYATLLSDGTPVELIPNGSSVPVQFADRLNYVRLVENVRLSEHRAQIEALRRGITKVLPVQVLNLLTWRELELLVCGRPTVDLDLLRRHTQYSGVTPDAPHILYFWRVLQSFNQENRRRFIRFAWAQERLPADDQEFRLSHTRLLIKASVAGGDPDTRFPKADTCFFNVELPAYSSEEILRSRLIYAMQTTSMNADDEAVDLHGRHIDGHHDDE